MVDVLEQRKLICANKGCMDKTDNDKLRLP